MAKRVRFKFDRPANDRSREYCENLLAEVRESADKIDYAPVADILSRVALPADATQWEVCGLIVCLRSARRISYDGLWTMSALDEVSNSIANAITRDYIGSRVTDADLEMAYLALEESVAGMEELLSRLAQ